MNQEDMDQFDELREKYGIRTNQKVSTLRDAIEDIDGDNSDDSDDLEEDEEDRLPQFAME